MPPLAQPDPHGLPELALLAKNASVDLFIQRGRAVRPAFELSADNAAVVSEVCKCLEGIPLAIELAASLVKVLPLRAILSRLDHRLDVLIGGPRDLPPRQQTLRNTIAWSYNLLDAGDQRLFRHLSVFVGGCTPEAVAAVCPDQYARITSLIDQSLVQPIGDDEDQPGYTILETLRETGWNAGDRWRV